MYVAGMGDEMPCLPQGWVEDRFSVSSSCDYDVSRDRVLGASCRQTWQLSQPTADDVQVVVT